MENNLQIVQHELHIGGIYRVGAFRGGGDEQNFQKEGKVMQPTVCVDTTYH